MRFGRLFFYVNAWLLPLSCSPQPQEPARAQQGACAAEVSVLYPADSSVLSIGSGRFPQDYLAVESCTPRVCRYSEQNVSYDRMTPFSNPGNGLYQTSRLFPEAGKTYTYYIACRAASGDVTKPVKLTFAMDAKPSLVVSNLYALAVSPTTVHVGWLQPNAEPKQYQLFRDGTLVTTSRNTGFVDRKLKPGTLYHYSVAATFAGGETTRTPEVPVKTLSTVPDASPAPPLLLDDFESPIRVVNAHLSDAQHRDLWSVYPGGDLSRATASIGSASVSTEDAHGGKSSLKAVVTAEVQASQKPGGLFLLFYPYTEKDNHWHFMREYVRGGPWKFDTYNRLRIWIKVPKSFSGMRKPVGQFNTELGTYVRATNGNAIGSGGSESGLGGNHFYHKYNIPYSGQWHQLILDSHPTHVRGASGYDELGDLPNPSGEDGYNYFDLLTSFYVDLDSHQSLASYPSTFYLDDVELFKETNPENTEQIEGLNGVYIPESNEIFVGWGHPKDDDKTKYEVRYSFEDIHQAGWAHATPAPGGLLSPVSTAYNGMEYSTKAIKVAGHDRIMIAIKPQNSAGFRQIAIPLSGRN